MFANKILILIKSRLTLQQSRVCWHYLANRKNSICINPVGFQTGFMYM